MHDENYYTFQMNWLAKINLNTVVKRLGPLQSAILLCFLIATSIYTGYRLGNFYHSYQDITLAQQKNRLDTYYSQINDLQSKINMLEVELEVERIANQNSQSLLKSMEQEHYQVKKQLAFYEKVMAPEKEADGLVIDHFSIVKTQSTNHFRIQAVLVQQLLKKRFARGYVDFAVVGSQNGKPKTLSLKDFSELDKKKLAFSFQYFQTVEGEFTLPEGFIPEKVTLAAVLTKTKWQKYQRVEQKHTWLDVLEQ